MLRIVFAAFAAIGLLMASWPAVAARIAPMVIDVQPSGRASIGRVEVTNPDSREFPVEVQMFRGDISELGELSLSPADDQFLVFPAQAVVPANGQQVFRVQYVGEPNLPKSQIYYMSVREIPVKLEAGPPRVQIVVNFNVLVNVVPGGTSAAPFVESVRPATRDGVHGLEVRVLNRGTRYFAAGRSDWKFSGKRADGSDGGFTRSRNEMASVIGVGVIPPDRARVFFIPTDTPMAEGTVSVTLGG